VTISFLPAPHHQLYQLRLMTLLARCGRQHNTSAQKQLQKLPALALIGDYGSEGRLLARLRVLLEARGCRVVCVGRESEGLVCVRRRLSLSCTRNHISVE
jgi:hypothetical protein